MNTQQARVVDPILTTHSRGYTSSDVMRVGQILFPRAPVTSRGAKIITFGREHYRIYDAQRAPGGDKKRVRVGYTDSTVSLSQRSLSGEVAFEVLQDANTVPMIDLGRRAVNVPSESLAREQELLQATLAQDVNNYAAGNKLALTGADKWSAYDTSDPGRQVDDAHEVIRSKIGRRANVLALGPVVCVKAKRHPKIVGHFYSGVKNGPATVSNEQLAEYFGVKRVITGDDVYLAKDDGDDADFRDMWGNSAVLAFVPSVDGVGDIEVPSYGYTYYLRDHPFVESPWQDRDHDVWVYPVRDEYQPVLTGMDAGFLFSNVV